MHSRKLVPSLIAGYLSGFFNFNESTKMKRACLFLVGLVLVLVTGIHAAAPTNAATNSSYEYGGLEYEISASAGLDTLAGANDSMTLMDARSFTSSVRQGWEYILVRDAFTGTGSDSVRCILYADALTGSGSLLYRTAIDSFTTSEGEAVLLPFNSTVIGEKYRLKIITYAGNGGQLILNRFKILKRRPVVVNRNQ